MAHVLIIARSEAAAATILGELAPDISASICSTADEVRAASRGAVDAVICEASPLPLPEASTALKDENDAPPAILFADELTAPVAAEALRLRAQVHARAFGALQLGVAIEYAAAVARERRAGRRSDVFDAAQRAVLERISSGAALGPVLYEVASLVERSIEESLCSIMLLDRKRGRFKLGAAPNLPESLGHSLESVDVRPDPGGLDAALLSGERVIVENIASEERWKRKQLLLENGLHACWFFPILSETKELLGTCIVYRRKRGSPTERQIDWVERATHLAAIGIHRDRHVQEIRLQEQIRSTVYDTAHDGLCYIAVEPEEDGGEESFRCLSANNAFLAITQCTREQVFGKLVEEFVPARSVPRTITNFRRASRERVTVRWEGRSEWPGGLRYGETTVAPILDDSGHCTNLVCAVRDVTERKLRERRIAEQAALLDHTREAVIVRDVDGVVQYWNNGAAQMYGWSREDAVGRPITELIDRDSVGRRAAEQQLLQNRAWNGQLVQWTRDGHELTVDASWTILPDEPNREGRVLAIYNDATERARLQQRMLLAERLESLGALAGGVAHDFNNVLSAIMGTTGLAKREMAPDHAAQKRLDVIATAAKRGADLVRQILRFSQRRDEARRPVAVGQVVEEAVQLLRMNLPSGVEIRTALEATQLYVLADSSRIHQVIMNLATNAVQAMPSGGTVTIGLHEARLDSPLSGSTGSIRAGQCLQLTVTDNGSGMDRGTLARIFEPYFTTKAGAGTGLGLPLVVGIVKDHGGVLLVSSKVGEGTVVEVYLPASPAFSMPMAPVVLPDELRGSGEQILCVDGDESILAMLVGLLESLGYNALGFTDPVYALQSYSAQPETFRAIITDLRMPRMSGIDLAREAKAMNPDISVVLIAGYVKPEDETAANEVGVGVFLTKPDFLDDLAGTLRKALSAQKNGNEAAS